MRRVSRLEADAERWRSATTARPTLELWCKGGKGQFSVAGNTVIFVPGPMEDRGCPPARAQADDDLVAALSEAATWKRQGDRHFVHRHQAAAVSAQYELVENVEGSVVERNGLS